MGSVFILFAIVSFCGVAVSYAFDFVLKYFSQRIPYFKGNASYLDNAVLLISVLLIICWGMKFKVLPAENYEFRHGRYILVGQLLAFSFLLISVPLFKHKKVNAPKWMILISGFILLLVEIGEWIGINQE